MKIDSLRFTLLIYCVLLNCVIMVLLLLLIIISICEDFFRNKSLCEFVLFSGISLRGVNINDEYSA